MSFSVTVYVSCAIFAAVCYYVFLKQKASHAVVLTTIWGWMFLSNANFNFPGVPNFSKAILVVFVPTVFSIYFYLGRFLKYNISKYDLVIIAWIFCAPLSGLINGYGLYDAASSLVNRFLLHGIPYLLGRIFIVDSKDRKFLMEQFFLAAVVYVPLCWFEIRFSPQLHKIVYGFHPHQFAQTVRSVGWRPVVFMKHGLQVALFLLTAAIVALNYIRYGIYLYRDNKFLSSLFAFFIVVTVYATQSYFAFIKLSFYLFLYAIPHLLDSRSFYFVFTTFHFTYVFSRVNLIYLGDSLVQFIESIRVDPIRVKSVQFRFAQENSAIAEVSAQNPIFGLHTWSEPATTQEISRGNFIFDSAWSLVYRVNGLVGLFFYLATFILPVIHWCFSSLKNIKTEDRAFLSASVAVFTVLCLHNVMNTFDSPLYYIMLGSFYNFYIFKDKEVA